MAQEDNSRTVGNGFIHVMETFPCLFNIGTTTKPDHTRLTLMMNSLQDDVESEEYAEGLREKELNVLTWLYFQAGDLDSAKTTNDDSLCINSENLVTLGNRAFLEWYSGSDLSIFLDHLEKLKSKEDFPERRLNARGAQANLLFRLGGIYNMTASVQMYSDLVGQESDNFEFKYYHALALRRLKVMFRSDENDEMIKQLFRDIAENATEPFWQSSAMCELAILLANDNVSVRVVESLVERAMDILPDSPVVIRKCGMALTRQGNPRGIALLERSASLKANTSTLHSLAKCLVNGRLTRNMNKTTCDKNAELNFMSSYEISRRENIRPLVDLAFLHLTRKKYVAMEIYDGLLKNWMLKEVLKNTYMLSRIVEGWFQCLKRYGHDRNDSFFKRHISIALLIAFEDFKHDASPRQIALMFDMVVNPAYRLQQDKSLKQMSNLLRDCVNENSARKKLMKLRLKGQLEDHDCLIHEIEVLLEEDMPGEALFMLCVIECQENIRLDPSKQLQSRALLEEAKLQLKDGLISCKLFFHKLFNMRHLNVSRRATGQNEGDDDDDDDVDDCNKAPCPDADVLILQDGHHWKPFFQDSTEQELSDKTSVGYLHQNRMYEDVITHVFDLETITNPWLPFSGKCLPDIKAFSTLLKQFSVRLVLLVVDTDSSNGFLQMADYLLSAINETKQTDIAIVYTEGVVEDAARQRMPALSQVVRSFKADDHGFQQRADSKPVTELVGTEILDAYFSGEVNNAIEFFKFLAPME